VAVYAGATLSTDPAGIGALTISNSLYLNGAVKLRLNAGTSTNDVLRGITSLTYGGTLTVSNLSGTLSAGQTFTLFSAGSTSGNFAATNLPALPTGLTWNWTPAAGTLAVVSAVNTTPTNLMASVSGSSLTLTWPADHVGWRLQEQTNNVANGVSANPADWGTVSGSTTTNSETITINPTVPGGYYRLVYP